ncbi:MAG: transglutaminase-like domain-containing protein, partial [Myxococcota bacterium]|nr:transglutaminase-like domain-containing protein [Myxococcota bacterium]
TVPNWPEKSRWFCVVNEPQFESNAAIDAKVAEITRGLKTDDEKIAAIVHWSADEIRYSGISMGAGEGYTLHPGPMIFEDRSGVCKDKAGIAITMLRAAGYDVFPAMTMAGSRVERVPADQFNHCVVALRRDDGSWQMLDPTWVVFSPELWSSAEGEQHYVIGTPEGLELMQTPAFDPADNRLTVVASSTLAADGSLAGKVSFTGQGYAAQRLRREMVHYSTAADRQAWFEETIGHLGVGAVVKPVSVSYATVRDLDRPIRYDVSYEVPEYGLDGDDALYFAPPTAHHLITAGRVAPYLDAADLTEREQPLLLWAPRMREVTETVTLPSGYSVAHLPEDRTIDGPVASLTTHTEVKGRKLVFTYELVVKRREIPVEHYENFREVVQGALALPDDLVVLERR